MIDELNAAREKYIGAWVRFQLMAELRIGVVSYVRFASGYPHHAIELVTDAGNVSMASVLESRPPPKADTP